MSTLVFLDTGPLRMVTNPRATPQTERCTHWMEGLLTRGVRALIPGARSRGSNPWQKQGTALGVPLPEHFSIDPVA